MAQTLRTVWIKTPIILVVLAFAGSQLSVHAQTSDLEQKKRALSAEIKNTSDMLRSTKKEAKSALSQLVILQSQIDKREELISTVQTEIDYTNESLKRSEEVIFSLERDLDAIQADYAEVMRFSFRNRHGFNEWIFLFNSESIGDAFRRWQYLKRYHKFRNQQIEMISFTQDMLTRKSEDLLKIQAEKDELLQQENQQVNLLEDEELSKNRMLTDLQSREKELKTQLQEKEQASKKLQQALADAMRANTSGESPKDLPDLPANQALSKGFSNNKGKLPWPVAKGVITGFYGEHPHPVLKRVKVKNDGIDIKTNPQADVLSVFEGTVSNVLFIPGLQNTVIIKHGNYYTAYSNLGDVSVAQGDAVSANQRIGVVGTQNSTGKTELHFEIWQGTNRQNPQTWLKKG